MFEQSVIQRIIRDDVLNVGVSLGFKGLSQCDVVSNQWEGFDVDLARAVAVSILGDSRKIHFVPLQSADRFQALRDGVIDLGTFNSSVTFQREAQFDVSFVHPMLFDGEVLMTSLDNLTGIYPQVQFTRQRRVAALRGSTTKDNLSRYFSSMDLHCEIVQFDSPQLARQAYQRNECDIYCLDRYLLAGEHAQLKDRDQHVILEDRISLEAMSPAVAAKDAQWHTAVRWIMRSLIEAENLNIYSYNINDNEKDPTGYLRTFLYPEPSLCQRLGIRPSFVRDVIRTIGNYGEIFDRNLGMKSQLKQTRRENKRWADGGMLWSPLFI